MDAYVRFTVFEQDFKIRTLWNLFDCSFLELKGSIYNHAFKIKIQTKFIIFLKIKLTHLKF